MLVSLVTFAIIDVTDQIQMQSVVKSSIKTVQEYSHNVKLLKYHLKKEQKLNETLRYKDSKKHKKETASKSTNSKQIHPFYAICQKVNELSQRTKEMGLLLADLFRMADSNYEGEITKEQFMRTILRLRSNLDQQLINEMFYAVDTNLNGLLSSDQYQEFLFAHGGCQSQEAMAYQRKAGQRLAALLKKKGNKFSSFLDNTLDPCGVAEINSKLKELKLNANESMILLKLWDPAMAGQVRHQVYLKVMENIKLKDQKQIQNQKFQKGIKQLCVLLRDKKLNPISIFEQAEADGKPGISPFELEQGLKKIIPSQTPFQIRKWVNFINLNNDQEITKEEFISAIRSFYSIQQISNFSAEYEKLHPTLKKALIDEDIPAEKIINQLSIAIEDSGLTKTEVFHRIDINHNGLVDKQELLEGLKHLGINVGLIAKVLTVFDRDASGELSLDEWLSILGEDLQMEEVQEVPETSKNKVNQTSKKKVNQQTKPQKGTQKQKQLIKKVEKESNNSENKKNQPLKDKEVNKRPSKKISQTKRQNSVEQDTKKKNKGNQAQKNNDEGMIKLKKTVLSSKIPGQKFTEDPQIQKNDEDAMIKIKKTVLQTKIPGQKFREDQREEDAKVPKGKAPLNQPKGKNAIKATQGKTVKMEERNDPIQSQHQEEKQVDTQPIERQIAEQYAQSKAKVLKPFKQSSKNPKKGITFQQFATALEALGISQSGKQVQRIYEDNVSSNGKFDYEQWLDSLPQKYSLEIASQHQGQRGITPEIESRIPEIYSRKELPNQSYAQQYDQNFENQNQSKVKEETAKRGQNKKQFEEIKKLVIQNQVHTDQGYKFSGFIGSEQETEKLKKVYLPNAKKLKEKKTIFKDKSFPAERTSLTDNPSTSKIQNVTLLKWKHYSQVYKSAKLFQKGIEPSDIVQGQLGDCYFLCSLAGLAEYNRLIQRLFEYYDLENGYFLIWFCIDGVWRLIEVDGYIPVKPDGKAVVFSRGRAGDEELWVLLLEKAYAKAYGCYQHIVGGQPYQAIKDLSGAPGQSFNHKNKNITLQGIWDKLNQANKMQFIMTCGTDQSDKSQFKLQNHSQSVTTEGIVIGHAYSILDLAVYKGQKLIQLRNPWGTMEWNGAWSDKSNKWTADAKAALKYTDSKDDGIFWMPFETYFKYYATTAINYIRPNYYYTSERKLKVKNLIVKIEAGSASHGFVMVAQQDHRKRGLPSNTPYNVCHLISVNCNNGKVMKKLSDQKYMYQRQGSVQISEVDSTSEIIILINLQNAVDFNLCTYASSKMSYEVDDSFDSMLQYIEEIAQIQQNAKNVQSDEKQTFKSWLTSVGEYAFLVFKNTTKKDLTITIQLKQLSNLKLLESSLSKKMKIKAGACESIKGKIIDAKQPFSFGPMSIMS